jgi:carbamoyl-phosphate synthase large subunit
MPKRSDLHSILIIGSGPIVIGQAVEFDYSGTQACKALRDEGYRIILVNSNPATIMTDPEFADRTYVEPLTPESLERIIEREKPDAILPTVGDRRASSPRWRCTKTARRAHGVELIGANYEDQDGRGPAVVQREDDEHRRRRPQSAYAASVDDAEHFAARIGYPSSSALRSPSADRVAASRTTSKSSARSSRADSISRPSTASSSRSR